MWQAHHPLPQAMRSHETSAWEILFSLVGGSTEKKLQGNMERSILSPAKASINKTGNLPFGTSI